VKTSKFHLLTSIGLSLILIVAGCAAPSAQEIKLKTTEQQIQTAVQTELNKLDLDMSNEAASLSRTGLSGTEARNILNGLPDKYRFIIDTCTADPAGKMVTVAPDSYRSYEGSDISQQTVTIEFNKTKKPVLSQIFQAVEGMNSVVIMWPIVSQKGEYIGSLSALFVPQTLLASASEPVLRGTDIALDVFQLDGLDIYDSTGNDTGKNLFTDPVAQQFTDLIAMGHRMMAEESGSGSYTTVDPATGKNIKKLAYWGTIKLHDTDWRLMTTLVVK
jgi:hypothetical protein